MNKSESQSFFAAKNLRRKEAKLTVRGNAERILAEEARVRRRGLAGENSRTLGAFGNLKGAEYDKFVAGTTGESKT
jgi:hypothetical protein